MSGLVTTGEKNLVLVSGRAHMDLAHAVGEEIGCGVSPVTAYDFASGEIYVRFNESCLLYTSEQQELLCGLHGDGCCQALSEERSRVATVSLLTRTSTRPEV